MSAQKRAGSIAFVAFPKSSLPGSDAPARSRFSNNVSLVDPAWIPRASGNAGADAVRVVGQGGAFRPPRAHAAETSNVNA